MAVFNEPTQWDHELGNNADVSTLPDDTSATSGAASLQKLFQIINQTPLEAGGVAPDREDFNALFKVLGDSVFYGMNGGLASYNPAYDYVVGRYVVYNNTLYKCIQANGASSTVVAPDSVSPLGSDYWKDIENQDSTSLIPNQIIQSPVPLTDANLHLLDGALLSGSGAYADYVAMMGELYNADPTATCWTDETTWQASVTTYGECGKFVYNSVNNTLRLPKLTSFVQATSTANELGSLVEAGAPNITGVIKNNYGGTGTGNIPTGGWQQGTNGSLADANNVATGALSDLNGNQGGSYNPPYVGATAGFSFDASKSNSIYGNSNTIQPQAIKYYFYIVLGTVSKTQVQIDIDNVMADLALKADKDGSNITQLFSTNLASNLSNVAKIAIAHNAMPSDVYDDLTLGASGSTYTAPADGYVFIQKHTSAGLQYVKIYNLTSNLMSIGGAVSGDGAATFLPVKKNDTFIVNYTANGVTDFFRFVYAVGSESEQ